MPSLPAASILRGPSTPSEAPVTPTEHPVLVVDDDRLVRAMLGDILKRAGAPFVGADSAEAARPFLERKPRAVFLDLNLPGQQGDTFCHSLRLDPTTWDIPVVMMTASDRRDSVRRCFVAGADDFLVKPLLEGQVLSKLAALASPVAPPATVRLGRRVVVASTKHFFTAMVTRLLEKAGFQVTPADSHAAGTTALGAGDPAAVVVVDLDLPHAQELVALAKTQPGLHVVAVAERAATLNSDLLPFDVETELEHLIRRVNKLLAGSIRPDRRASQRIPFHTVVQFRLFGEGEEAWLAGYSFDLSETGVYVRTLTPLPTSKPIEISFALHEGAEQFTARGLVVWSNPFGPRTVYTYPYGMGVTFSEFPVAEWTQLREYIQVQKGSAG